MSRRFVIGRRCVLGLIGLTAAAMIALAAYRHARPTPSPPTAPATAFAAPPFSDSPYANTRPGARFVGTGACVSCHAARYDSYLLTAHSRALADLDPNAEPPDAAFVHQASGRAYRVYRQDGQLRHEELLRAEDGTEIARVDQPIRYVIGSGNFCRSYIVESDGFLQESPLTWYTTKQQWGLSPGYDFAQHYSFERPIRMGCAVCHAGDVEAAEGSVHRLVFHEKSIGCESCHGPGSPHVALQTAGPTAAGDDRTIVNPAKLSRSRLEDVCASCHLSGPATVWVRGRRAGDYRPGMPLTEYRTDYRFDRGDEQMTVVGHMEQLRQSKCYRQSADLTCVTCHDPHEPEKPKDSVAFYRQKCLDCHADKPCSLDEAARRRKAAGDDCAACHMPRGDTEIPHIAFTHHRIGLHPAAHPAAIEGVPNLVPTGDDSHLPPLDRQRNLGLAYQAVANDPRYRAWSEEYRERSRTLLEEVYGAGLRDVDTAEALAEICWRADPERGADYAREVLAAKDAPGQLRAPALSILAQFDMQGGDFVSAIGLLEEAVRLRRQSEDWRLLGRCYVLRGEPAKALPALEQALAVRPSSPAVHEALAEAYARLGDAARAAEHQKKARWLVQHHQE